MISQPITLSIKSPTKKSLHNPRNANTQSMIFPHRYFQITPPNHSKAPGSPTTRKKERVVTTSFRNNLEDLCDILDNGKFSQIDWNEVFEKTERFKAISPHLQDDNLFEGCRNKWSTREIPSNFTSNRQRNSFIAHSLKENMGSIALKYPDYFDGLEFQKSDSDPFLMESEVWIFILNEIISEVAETSKSSALLLETMKKRLSFLFEKMTDYIREEQKVVEVVKTVMKEGPSIEENKKLSSQNEILRQKIVFMEKDMSNLLEEVNEQKKYATKARAKQQHAEAQALRLTEINAEMREEMVQQNQRIYTLSSNNHYFQGSDKLGIVPPDVIKAWEQTEHMLNLVTSGALENFDYSGYLPQSGKEVQTTAFFKLPANSKHVANPENLHYATFFELIQKFPPTGDPDRLQLTVEEHIRKMLGSITKVYFERVKDFNNVENSIRSKLKDKMREKVELQITKADWILPFVENPSFFKQRKPSQQDFQSLVGDLAAYINDLYKDNSPDFPESANEAITKFFDTDHLISFIKGVGEEKNKRLCEHLFYRAMTRKMPFHEFVFMCRLYSMTDNNSTSKVFSFLFDNLDWNHENDTEQMQSEIDKSIPFFLGAYRHCIDVISKQTKKESQGYNVGLLLNEGLNEKEAAKTENLLIKISGEKSSITETEVAVFYFWRRNKFDVFTSDYNINEDPYVVELNEFLSSKKKKKGKK